ncbi:hypothetical protein [Bacillus cytotoxicus]|uniref:hypothetical protein n=1 Tax=Bacillus cytotoxicus TaxID=580165 RepID=UPI000B95DDE6|nr:hypothetical protein [Bacillus cytotoxicus]AWC45813.1 hypothetical protein CG479_015730 [Bacillus cytotoxicus]AWC53913.1 hypothetical protein CG477_016740 [Bacillus cytotoxicus]AWC58040.1 hypothetical protein CG476_016765 [Bacillus cytotoxicus]AWC66174.1 hypothetical protein CG475_016770 [Bacillus cytotoxicus]EMA6344860.1 hypothetical protein [Bacillus cytotoxicus]
MQVINLYQSNTFVGVINQVATPLQEGDIVEVINKYHDPTTVGDWVYSVRIMKTSNKELAKHNLNGIRLVACYKVDVLPKP